MSGLCAKVAVIAASNMKAQKHLSLERNYTNKICILSKILK